VQSRSRNAKPGQIKPQMIRQPENALAISPVFCYNETAARLTVQQIT